MNTTPENNTPNPRLVRLFRAIRPDTPTTIGCTQIGFDIAGRLRIGIVIRPTSKLSIVHFRTKPELHLRVWIVAVTYRTNTINTTANTMSDNTKTDIQNALRLLGKALPETDEEIDAFIAGVDDGKIKIPPTPAHMTPKAIADALQYAERFKGDTIHLS